MNLYWLTFGTEFSSALGVAWFEDDRGRRNTEVCDILMTCRNMLYSDRGSRFVDSRFTRSSFDVTRHGLQCNAVADHSRRVVTQCSRGWER